VHRKAVSQSRNRGTRKRDLGFGHLTDELREFTCRVAAAIPRWSVIYSDVESITLWKDGLERVGATYIRTIPWVRWSMPQLSGDRPTTGAEAVIIAWGSRRGRKHWNGPGSLTHFDHKALRGEDKHKTEKPLDQALDLVSYFSDEGETVLDPFAGAGTFGIACQLLSRGYVGVELDPEWAAKARARLESDELSARDAERYERWRDS